MTLLGSCWASPLEVVEEKEADSRMPSVRKGKEKVSSLGMYGICERVRMDIQLSEWMIILGGTGMLVVLDYKHKHILYKNTTGAVSLAVTADRSVTNN